jgi:hypothetical protein
MRFESIEEVMKKVEGKKIYSYERNKTLPKGHHWTGFGRGFTPSEIYFYEASFGWVVVYVQDERVYQTSMKYDPNIDGSYDPRVISRRDAKLSSHLSGKTFVVEEDVFKSMLEPYFEKVEVEFRDGDIVAVPDFEGLVVRNVLRNSGYTYPHHTRRLTKDIVLAWYAVKDGDRWSYSYLDKNKTWNTYTCVCEDRLKEMVQDGNAEIIADKHSIEILVAKYSLLAA